MNILTKTTAVLVAGLISISPASAQDERPVGSLSITFETKEPVGKVRAVIFQSAEDFSSGKALHAVSLSVQDTRVFVSFPELPTGEYAVRAFHDMDGDGELAKNPFGIPTEPVAFSNGAKVRFGAPSWKDCKFVVTADGQSQTLSF
ncbi:MAG: DUF2141 domain-containing protein [Pseudomonadota bacterium]